MPNSNNKKHILSVYNTLTGRYEEVEVSEEVYRTCKRTQWNIKDNDKSYYEHEIQFSGLIGGQDGNYENFREFVVNTFEEITTSKIQTDKLLKVIDKLPESERLLIQSVFFDDMTEKEYGKKMGVSQQAIHKRKGRILKKLKKLLK